MNHIANLQNVKSELETWKPFMKMLVGDPETEQEFLTERSPRTYIEQVTVPMLVVQGKNDPRVIE